MFPVLRQWFFLGLANGLPVVRLLEPARLALYRASGMAIGKGTRIASPLQLGLGNARFIEMGEKCFLNADILLHGPVRLGNRVSIGARVTISAYAHPPVLQAGGWKTTVEPVIIEDGALIGMGAIILPGVRIGRGAYVAAGAVVSRDVAPYTLVVGVPARFMKEIEQNDQ